MCYSEFGDIIKDIDDMDADVITFEASRSDLTIIDALNKCGFKTEVGPGVYDIHSPRVSATREIVNVLHKMLDNIQKGKLWVNPDNQPNTISFFTNLAYYLELICKI